MAMDTPLTRPILIGLDSILPATLPSSSSAPSYQLLIDSLQAQTAPFLASLKTDPPTTWHKGKTFNKPQFPTDSYSTTTPLGVATSHNGLKWHARTTVLSEANFDQFRQGLLVEHTKHEQEYVESCAEAELVQVVEKGVLEVWRTAYHLPFPTSNRDFVFLIATLDTTPAPSSSDPTPSRSFQVISIPFESPSRPGWLRAKYASVEEVVENPNGGVTWTMATTSDTAGSIPRFLAEMAMPGKIAEDVPSFVEWLKKHQA